MCKREKIKQNTPNNIFMNIVLMKYQNNLFDKFVKILIIYANSVKSDLQIR